MRLLVVEDDALLARLLERELDREGYLVAVADSVRDATIIYRTSPVDVLLTDWNLADGTGVELIAGFRRDGRAEPAMLITVRDGLDDRVAALDAGADDILVKPFAVAELRARVRALLRRPTGWQPERYAIGGLRIDDADRSVAVGDRSAQLTPREWAVLRVLARHQGRVVDRSALVSGAWDESHDPQRALEVHLSNLRSKLAAIGSTVTVVNRRGVGYQLVDRAAKPRWLAPPAASGPGGRRGRSPG